MIGCTRNEYEVELTPTDGGIQRSITCRSVDALNDVKARIALDELQQIADSYGADVGDLTADEHTFTKIFAEAMPTDVGGSGSYRRWDTSLGSLGIYVERFRGDDDWLSEIEGRHEAIDSVVDLLLGWLTTELEQQRGFDQLQEFLDDQFRRDLKNLCLYAWVAQLMPQQEDMTVPVVEVGMRIGQYFVERSYFTIEELPEITRAIQEYRSTEHPQRILAVVQRLIAKKMGAVEEIPSCLNFLGHPLAVKQSIDQYLIATDDYTELLDQWHQEQADTGTPDAEQPEPTAVISHYLARAFLPDLFRASDSLKVSLACKSEPFVTNGQWIADKGQVRWERTMNQANQELFSKPTLLFALWAQPNEQIQHDRFGKTILDNKELAAYCLWHRGLNQQEADQWESLLASFSPGGQTIKQLEKFRFSHEPPATEEHDDDLAATARDLIGSGLEEEN